MTEFGTANAWEERSNNDGAMKPADAKPMLFLIKTRRERGMLFMSLRNETSEI